MRHTSIKAWDSLVASRRLGKRQSEAYDCVYRHGPVTAREMVDITGIDGLWKRTSELDRLGVIAAVGERVCRVTGEMSVVWDVTDKVPTDGEIASVRSNSKNKRKRGILWMRDGSCLIFDTWDEAKRRLSVDHQAVTAESVVVVASARKE